MDTLTNMTPMLDTLPPTAGGKARALKWFAKPAGFACDHVAVVEEAGKGADAYAVHEFKAGGGRGFHCFKAGSDEPYTVFASDSGEGWDSCSCAGGCYRRGKAQPCRHLLSVRTALANGWIEPKADEYPIDPPYTDDELRMMAAEYEAEERARMADVA
jgi:hypothetical protein